MSKNPDFQIGGGSMLGNSGYLRTCEKPGFKLPRGVVNSDSGSLKALNFDFGNLKILKLEGENSTGFSRSSYIRYKQKLIPKLIAQPAPNICLRTPSVKMYFISFDKENSSSV